MTNYYFDYNSTHPPFANILKEVWEDSIHHFYNPSGPSRFSLRQQGIIEEARNFFAKYTGKQPDNFVFSSTGTEANYFLLYSLQKACNVNRVIVSPFEHPSIWGALSFLGIEPIILKTSKTGVVDLNDLEDQLKKEPLPVIVLYASNETGVIQPMQEIYSIASQYGSPLFSDLMQVFGKIEVDFSILQGFTFSGHKIGAGMGASSTYLNSEYLSKDIGIFSGGNQENNHRAGTENVFAIHSFRKVSEFLLQEGFSKKNERLHSYQKKIDSLLIELGAEVIAQSSLRLPSTSFSILPVEDIDFIMMGLEERRIIISNGSSCKSRAREASPSLLSMGYLEEEALKAIRISTGFFTTQEEVDFLLQGLKEVIGMFV